MVLCLIVLTTFVPLFHAVESDAAIPSGAWSINANNFHGELLIRQQDQGQVTGWVFGHPIHGTFNSDTRRIRFTRRQIVKRGEGQPVQEFEGLLNSVPDSIPPQYVLEGTFWSVAGPEWGRPGEKTAWQARTLKTSRPEQDLEQLQGDWQVSFSKAWLSGDAELPKELHLNQAGKLIRIHGNQVLSDGRLLAVIANRQLPASWQTPVEMPGYRLLLLTLPDGRAVACSYAIMPDGVSLHYPYALAGQGTGHLVRLTRAARIPE